MCVSSSGRKVERDKGKKERLERDREKKKVGREIGGQFMGHTCANQKLNETTNLLLVTFSPYIMPHSL